MAITQRADLVNLVRIVRTLVWERLARNINVFNAASNNAIQLVGNNKLFGSQTEFTFLKRVNGTLVRARDIDATTALEEVKMEEGKEGTVKLDRTTPALAVMIDAFTREGRSGDMDAWMEAFANQVSEAIMDDYVDSVIKALVGCLTKAAPSTGTWVYDITGNTDKLLSRYTLDLALNTRFGDQRHDVVAWIMRADASQQVEEAMLTEGASNEVGATLLRGRPVDRFGRRTFEGDLPALLHATGTPDTIRTLALKRGAARVILNMAPEVYVDDSPMAENPLTKLRWLWRYDLQIEGFGYNQTAGGDNPNDATLAAGANWTHSLSQDKALPGIVIVHNSGYRAIGTK